jgi:hypothetical protein
MKMIDARNYKPGGGSHESKIGLDLRGSGDAGGRFRRWLWRKQLEFIDQGRHR